MGPDADRSRLALTNARDRTSGPAAGTRGDSVPDWGPLGGYGRRLRGWAGDGWRRAALRGGSWLSVPDIYWRRRFFTLAGGLAVLSVITWGLSVLVGPAKPIAATQSAARASLSARDTLPPQAYGTPVGPSPALAPTAATMFPPGVPSAWATATPAASPPGSGAASSPTQSPAAQAGQCSPASIVFSLFTSQPEYGPHQQPRFEVDAVSTAPGTCSMAYGASLVRIVVTWQGKVIWDSAACQAPAATSANFAQGVPQVATVTWNRQAADPACAGSAPAAANGTFQAVAMAGGRSTPVLSFKLLR
jgi:hypothetical protein